VVEECVVVLLPEFVVLFVAELLDQGCQTKIAIKMAITTTITMPSAAAPPPLPLSLTTTGPSAIRFSSPFEHQAAWLYPDPASAYQGEANSSLMWGAIGLGCAACMTVLAMAAGARSRRSFYEHDVYGMSPVTHRAYAAAALAFVALFAACLRYPVLPTVPFLGAFAVLAILYGASFVRGATGEDEER